jgi:NAD(P)-dependent dehydrogenase (short-subunit alcohol dehydrogenase family)
MVVGRKSSFWNLIDRKPGGDASILGGSEAEIVEMAAAIPLGRMAQPDEIARAAVFLASENAGFVTGQTLHVNGGSYLA